MVATRMSAAELAATAAGAMAAVVASVAVAAVASALGWAAVAGGGVAAAAAEATGAGVTTVGSGAVGSDRKKLRFGSMILSSSQGCQAYTVPPSLLSTAAAPSSGMLCPAGPRNLFPRESQTSTARLRLSSGVEESPHLRFADIYLP